MGFKLGFAMAVTALTASYGQAATTSVGQLSAQLKGTTVTVAGKVSGWRDSWKETAPNTFYVQDATGSVRTCIWPNQLPKVAPNVTAALKIPGTAVQVTGSVDVFQNKIEIHVAKGSDVVLAPVTAGASNTTATLASSPLR